jgi:hypothetical protein
VTAKPLKGRRLVLFLLPGVLPWLLVLLARIDPFPVSWPTGILVYGLPVMASLGLAALTALYVAWEVPAPLLRKTLVVLFDLNPGLLLFLLAGSG